ncbi:MAG: asparaginase, partial [Actinomycetota bacterium]
MASVPSVRVVRSGLVESVHLADVAVCDADGRLVAFAGEAGRPVYGRSCTKPLQASVSLAAIGDEPLSDRQIAIACASHNGEPVHLAAVRSVLRRGGLGVDALRTPPGWPLDPATMARARTKTPLRHNCSGKHAGMLA